MNIAKEAKRYKRLALTSPMTVPWGTWKKLGRSRGSRGSVRVRRGRSSSALLRKLLNKESAQDGDVCLPGHMSLSYVYNCRFFF